MGDDMAELKVVETLYESNARDIASMLTVSAKSIADERDDPLEENPTVSMVAVQVSQNGNIKVYGWGATDMHLAIAALHLGLTEVSRIQLGIPVRR